MEEVATTKSRALNLRETGHRANWSLYKTHKSHLSVDKKSLDVSVGLGLDVSVRAKVSMKRTENR